jgi:hypothetical protein
VNNSNKLFGRSPKLAPDKLVVITIIVFEWGAIKAKVVPPTDPPV